MGIFFSRILAEVAKIVVQSAMAFFSDENMRALWTTFSAPFAAAIACWFGHFSRGSTIRSLCSPQLYIALALMPMFSPICGRIRIMMGVFIYFALGLV